MLAHSLRYQNAQQNEENLKIFLFGKDEIKRNFYLSKKKLNGGGSLMEHEKSF